MDKRIVAVAVVLLITAGAYVGIMSLHTQQSTSTSPATSTSSSGVTSGQSSSTLTRTTSLTTSSSTISATSSATSSTTHKSPTAYFVSLNVNSTEGAISVSPPPAYSDGGYAPGTILTFTPRAVNQGGSYTFLKWTGDFNGSSNPLVARINRNLSLGADFFNDDVLLKVSPSCPSSVVSAPPPPETQAPPAKGTVNFSVVGQVGGVTQAVAAQGNYLYVGVGSRMTAFDISDPTSLKELGSTVPLNGTVTGIALEGNEAYASAGGGGIYVVSLANPASPVVVGSYQSHGYAEGLTVSGSYVFVADGPDGLQILNVTDGASPHFLASVYSSDYVFGVSVAGGVAYLAAGGSGILTVDVSDPATPVPDGRLALPGYAYGVSVSGGAAYVAGGWGGIQVVDTSNPADPKLVGSSNTTGWAMGLSLDGGTAFVAEGESGLQIYLLRGQGLTHVGGFHTSGSTVVGLSMESGLAFLADANQGVLVVDVSNPSHPRELGSYSTLSAAESVAIAGPYVYVGSTNDFLRVVDISDPTLPKELGGFATIGYPGAITASSGFAYVPTPNLEALFAFNMSDSSNPDPLNPVPLTFYTPGGEFGGLTAGAPRGALLQGSTLYIADEKGFIIFDVSNPAAPCMLGHVAASTTLSNGAVTNSFVNVAVAGGLAFLSADNSPTTVIVDVTNPRAPQVVGSYDFVGGRSNGVGFYNGVLYVLGDNNLYAINATDPSQTFEISALPLPNPTNDVFSAVQLVSSSGGKLLVLDGSTLEAIDVSDPSMMTISGSLDLPYPPSWVCANASNIFVADNQGGVFVIRMAPGDPSSTLTAQGQPMQPPAAGRGGSPVLHIAKARSFLTSLVTGIEVALHRAWAGLDRYLTRVGALLQGESGTPAAVGSQSDPPSCVVTSTSDSGSGSLRACVQSVNFGSIIFSPAVFPPSSPSTIYLSSPLTIHSEVVVNGTGAGVMVNGSKMASGDTGFMVPGNHSTVEGLTVVDFPSAGIVVSGSNDTIKADVVSGNHDNGVKFCCGEWVLDDKLVGSFVGTDPTGTEVLGSQNQGVTLSGALTTIGGPSPWQRNVISGNLITDIVGTNTYGNVIEGNYIGLDSSGERLLGSGGMGITLQVNSSDNLVKGNVLGGGFDFDIIDPGSQFNVVVGNYFGLDATGTVELAPVILGVQTGYNVIGGAQPGDRNVIEGFILIKAPNVFVIGNYFGTDASGDKAFPGVDQSIGMQGCVHDFIGGMGPGEGNLMDTNIGINIQQGSSYDFVLGNSVGVDAKGQAVQHPGAGVSVEESQHIFIQGNTLSGSGSSGISLSSGADYATVRLNDVTQNQGTGLNASAGSVGNQIYANSFSGNRVNARDYGQGNQWDNGASGNYWSDYSGVNRGDGIGSTPYYVTPNGVDRYPLISTPSLPTT